MKKNIQIRKGKKRKKDLKTHVPIRKKKVKQKPKLFCIKQYFKEVYQDLRQKCVNFYETKRKYFGYRGYMFGAFLRRKIKELNAKSERRVILFSRNNSELYFKPFLAYQGIAVFVFFFFSFFAINSIFFPYKPDSSFIIKTAQTTKLTSIIAGGQPVQWSVILKTKDITEEQHLLKLPRSATKIKVGSITKQQALVVLSTKPSLATLTIKDRQKLAKSSQSSFLAGLTNIAGYLVADLQSALKNKKDEKDEKDEKEPEITKTKDAKYVDLTEEVIVGSVEDGPPPAEDLPLQEEVAGSVDVAPAEEPEKADIGSPLAEATADEYVEVTYETPAPSITEQELEDGKLVTVSDGSPSTGSGQLRLTDVIAFTTIPEIYKVGQEDKIKIKWKNNGDQSMEFRALDLDDDGKLDYVEWTVPHLSDQIFEIIFISKAWRLDSAKNITEDIYDTVATQDGNYATIQNNEYVRVTFESILDNNNDITLRAKPTDLNRSVTIDVYAEALSTQGSNDPYPEQLVATFENIDTEGTYKVLLTDLQIPTDVFDLRIRNADVDIDYIVDPNPADAYWVGGDGNFSDATNHWALTSGGSPGSDNLPGTATTIHFDVNSAASAVSIDTDISVAGVVTTADYSGTITQAATKTITIGASGYTQAGGTFTGADGGITLNGAWALSGGTFNAGSQTITVNSDWTYTAGTINANTSTVKFNNNTKTITGSHTLKNVTFAQGDWTTTIIASGTTLTVNGTLTFNYLGAINTGTIAAKGDINVTSDFTYGSTALLINGTGDQIFTDTAINSQGTILAVNINKASGILTLVGTIRTYNDWTYTAGTIDAGTSTVIFAFSTWGQPTFTITGSHALNNVTFGNANVDMTIALGTTLTVNGTLTFDGIDSAGSGINTGTIAAKGDITIADTNGYIGTATLLINGTGNQTFTGNATTVAGNILPININKASGTLTLAGTIHTYSDWTYTAGTIDAGISTVVFGHTDWSQPTFTITGSHALNNVKFGNSNVDMTIASGTTLTVNGTLTFDGIAAASSGINTGTIAAKGDITIADTNEYSGTATLLINGTGNQTFTGNATTAAGNILPLNINKASGTLTLAGTIYTRNNWTYTAGTIDAGISTVVFGHTDWSQPTFTITGSHSLNNVTFVTWNTAITIASGTTLTVNGTLAFDGPSYGTIDTGTIAAQGDITIADAYSYTGTTILNLTGTANQDITVTGSGALLFSPTINKPSGTVTSLSALSLNAAGQDLTITSGTLDLAGYALTVNDQFTIGASGTLAMTGDESSVTTPTTITSGASIVYNATSGSRNIQNWTYTNATLKFTGSGGTTIVNTSKTVAGFELGAGAIGKITSGQTLTVAGNFTSTATSGSHATLSAVTPSSVAYMPVSGTATANYVEGTDIDSTGGTEINNATGGSNTRCTNWHIFNATPTLTSVSDSTDPIKGGNTIIITPSGQADTDSDALYYYCNETGSPTSADTLCGEANQSYASPYTSTTCHYDVSTGNTTRTVYCRAYDGTAYSTERTTTYTVDSTAPTLSETTAITTPTIDTTPSYVFNTNEAGTITYAGSCTSATTSATSGSNTITFTALSAGTYSNCTITVTDAVGNASTALSVTTFVVLVANVPSDLQASYTPGTSDTITTSWSANSNPAGTQYYVENTTLNTNSGWITATTHNFTNLNCATSYSFRVKSRDSTAITESAFTDSISKTITCPGGGGIGQIFTTITSVAE